MVVLGAVLAAPVIVMLIRMILRAGDGFPAPAPPPLPDEPEETVLRVREALRAGLADLDSAGDPRRAVIACWLRLEHAAARAGTPRALADTPADLVARLLAAHRVGEAALERLAAAYRRARYSPHEVDDPCGRRPGGRWPRWTRSWRRDRAGGGERDRGGGGERDRGGPGRNRDGAGSVEEIVMGPDPWRRS
nr:hypothetical protein GCM10020093_023570 [Planobispora longispora]